MRDTWQSRKPDPASHNCWRECVRSRPIPAECQRHRKVVPKLPRDVSAGHDALASTHSRTAARPPGDDHRSHEQQPLMARRCDCVPTERTRGQGPPNNGTRTPLLGVSVNLCYTRSGRKPLGDLAKHTHDARKTRGWK